jgi:hypothetical protein
VQDYRFVERGLLEHAQISVKIGMDDKPLWSVGIGGEPNDAGSCFLAAEGRTLEVACKRLIASMRLQIDRVNDAILVPVNGPKLRPPEQPEE